MSASLRFETLEKRQMLAVLGLDVQVLADRSPMIVGDDFWLQVQAQDIRAGVDVTPGVISLPVNIEWRDSGEDVIALLEPLESPTAIPIDNPAVTASFPLQRFVDTIEPRRILGLRGAAIPSAGAGSEIGTDGPEEFSRWQFEAVGAGFVDPITVDLAGSMAFADAALLEDVDSRTGALEVQVVADGLKFNDLNGDGIRNEGEPGLPDWRIEVFRDDDESGTLNDEEFARGPLEFRDTGSDGNYSFELGVDPPDDSDPNGTPSSRLGTPAHYVIVERLPSDWEQTAPETPVWDGIVPPGYGPYGHPITVNVGDVGFEDRDFGNVEIPPDGLSSLSGFVYADGNNNAERDLDETGAPLEPGLPGVVIRLGLDDSDDPRVWTTTTAKDGWYHFNDLLPGTYSLREDQPAAFLDGQESRGVILEEGGDGRRIAGTVGQDVISDIRLGVAEHGIDFNFGELGLRADEINKRMFLTDPPIQEILCDRLGLECVTVRGTPEDNTIVFEAVGDVLRVTVDSQAPQEFPVEDVDILAIDAGAGTDTVVLNGDAGTIAHIQPGSGVIRSSDEYEPTDYSAEALNAETIIVDGGSLAVMRDTPNDDALVLDGSTATLTLPGADLVAIAMAYDSVHALSAYEGDDDTVERVEPVSLDFRLIGDWRAL